MATTLSRVLPAESTLFMLFMINFCIISNIYDLCLNYIDRNVPYDQSP